MYSWRAYLPSFLTTFGRVNIGSKFDRVLQGSCLVALRTGHCSRWRKQITNPQFSSDTNYLVMNGWNMSIPLLGTTISVAFIALLSCMQLTLLDSTPIFFTHFSQFAPSQKDAVRFQPNWVRRITNCARKLNVFKKSRTGILRWYVSSTVCFTFR